jgi:hypothetical protein
MNRMKKGGGENFLEEVFSPAPPLSRTFGKRDGIVSGMGNSILFL